MKFFKLILAFFLFALCNNMYAGADTSVYSRRGHLYATWGYNRAFFSKSDIHFKSDKYDVTLYDVVAYDRLSPFSADNYVVPENFLVPQYVFSFGYFITDRISVSIGMDHLKYVVKRGQTVLFSGFIDPSVSQKYGGQHELDPFYIEQPDMSFEHTNGLNIVNAEGQYLMPIFDMFDRKVRMKWNAGGGLGMAITKTDVIFLDDGIDNKFYVSGYDFHLKTGPRVEFFRNFFFEFQMKAGYINLPNVRIHNELPKRANHHFTYFETLFNIGLSFKIIK